MTEPADEREPIPRTVLWEMAFAIPAVIVLLLCLFILLNGLVALVREVGTAPRSINLAIGVAGVVLGGVGLAGGIRWWSRRSWLILTIPVWLVPIGMGLGWLYLINNWGG